MISIHLDLLSERVWIQKQNEFGERKEGVRGWRCEATLESSTQIDFEVENFTSRSTLREVTCDLQIS